MTREIAILRAAIKEKTARGIYALEKNIQETLHISKERFIFSRNKKRKRKNEKPQNKKKIFENIISLYIYSFSLYSQLFVYFGNLKNTIFEKVKLHKSLNPLNQTF